MNLQSCTIKVRWRSCSRQQIRVFLDGKKPVEEMPSRPTWVRVTLQHWMYTAGRDIHIIQSWGGLLHLRGNCCNGNTLQNISLALSARGINLDLIYCRITLQWNTHNLFWYIPEVMSPQQLFSSLQQKPQGRKAYEMHVGRTRPDGYKKAELACLENLV